MKFEKEYGIALRKVEEKLSSGRGGHDLDHTFRVLRNAEELAAEFSESRKEVVLFAALLHDIARPEEDDSRGKICHAALGAKLAEELLGGLKLPEEFCKEVARCIRSHRYRDNMVPETLEAKIVYDADKLDSLGAVGIGRAFLFAGAVGAKLHNDSKIALSSPAYGPEDTAYREFLVKLRKLPDAMLTLPGKQRALERMAFMENFFARLCAETGLK